MLMDNLDQELLLRSATSADIEWMYNCSPNVTMTLDYFRNELKAHYISWVVEMFNEPIGYILTSNMKGDSTNIHIVIHQDKRGFGYGSQIANSAFSYFNNKFAIDRFYFKLNHEWLAAVKLMDKIEASLIEYTEDTCLYLKEI